MCPVHISLFTADVCVLKATVFQGIPGIRREGNLDLPSIERSFNLWPLQEASIGTELALTAEAFPSQLVDDSLDIICCLGSKNGWKQYILLTSQ